MNKDAYIELLEKNLEQQEHMFYVLTEVNNSIHWLSRVLGNARRDPSDITKNWLSNHYRLIKYASQNCKCAKIRMDRMLKK